MEIKTFGPVDERSRKQLETCMKAGDADFGVLCADHHPGYSQPIEGAIAYEGYISPSGVGYDIACIATGSRVTTAGSPSVPIEQVAETDHRIRVKTGWRQAADLRPGERVACAPYGGMRADTRAGYLDVAEPSGSIGKRPVPMVEELYRLGLWPLRLEDKGISPLLRLLGHNCGDGHLSKNGKRASFWTTDPADASSIRADIVALGFPARQYRRRRPNGSNEIHVTAGSVALHALLVAMGAPVGRKEWPEQPMPWLFRAPAWVRCVYLSAFASAEGTTPRLVEGRIANLAIKQAGETPHAADFVARLLRSVGFRASA